MSERSTVPVALLAALLGGLVGSITTWALVDRSAPPHPVASPSLQPVLDRLDALLGALRQPALQVPPAEPAGPVRESIDPSPLDATEVITAVDRATERLQKALDTLATRLEKVASDNLRSEQLAEMIQSMAQLPRNVPPDWRSLDQVLALGDSAGAAVAYLTPEEIVRRFGDPQGTSVETEEGIDMIVWSYSKAVGDHTDGVNLFFVAGHVVRAECW